jgi:hypothetical protein
MSLENVLEALMQRQQEEPFTQMYPEEAFELVYCAKKGIGSGKP